MPIYEYVCEDCQKHFEKLVSREESVSCPACSSNHLEKQFSRFGMSAASSNGSYESLPVYNSGGCGCTPSSCGCKN